jgi:adenosylcobinamide kinase / adenosylcobinamide-phosphate guanylyltransferase
MLSLLIGGARSGKSRLAVEMASRAVCPVIVVATAEPRDEEMVERIARHKAERPSAWSTCEEPLDLAGALRSTPEDALVVVDCLTLWVSNLIERGEKDIPERAMAAAGVAAERMSSVIAVTNEVGSGIIPDNPLARRYADALGAVNVIWSQAAENVLLVVAGRVLPLDRHA